MLIAISIPLYENHTVSMATIPILGGILGWVINWSGVWMLYRPLYFRGVRVPGLRTLTRLLPQKLREVPGLKHGGVGWQGIIPSRAGKLGAIAVETQIDKIASPDEVYARLKPDEIADYIVARSDDDMRELIEEVMQRDHPEIWRDLTPEAREAVHARVQEELPEVVHGITEGIGANMEHLFDVKRMVIRLSEEDPMLTNRLFHEVGAKEFRFIMWFGGAFGFVMGFPTILLVTLVPYWWTLPLAQAVIGCVTNWIGIWMIYEPRHPKQIGRFTIQGLFLRRQHEASATYGKILADDVLTLRNIGEELLHGPRSDRIRKLIEDSVRPVVDRAAGQARGLVRAAIGAEEYDAVRDAVAVEAVEHTLEPMQDPELNRQRNPAVRELVTERMRDLPPEDFSETMRAATREDEWMLIAHGALFGIGGGLLHWFLFGV